MERLETWWSRLVQAGHYDMGSRLTLRKQHEDKIPGTCPVISPHGRGSDSHYPHELGAVTRNFSTVWVWREPGWCIVSPDWLSRVLRVQQDCDQESRRWKVLKDCLSNYFSRLPPLIFSIYLGDFDFFNSYLQCNVGVGNWSIPRLATLE